MKDLAADSINPSVQPERPKTEDIEPLLAWELPCP
jgi:hypothetical protein